MSVLKETNDITSNTSMVIADLIIYNYQMPAMLPYGGRGRTLFDQGIYQSRG